MVRRGKKGRGNGERQLGRRWSIALFGTSRVLIICIIAAFQFLDGTLEQKDICPRLAFKEYPNFTERSCPRNVGGRISQRYEREQSPRTIHKYGNEGKENGKNFHYKENHVAIDSLGPGPVSVPVDCPIPFLNPLTKLRNGSSSQSKAPDGVFACVLARVRGLVSESSSSGSRCRFFPPPNRAAASTAVASVEATDNGGRFSDFPERLGLTSEALVAVS